MNFSAKKKFAPSKCWNLVQFEPTEKFTHRSSFLKKIGKQQKSKVLL
jgi:hypothetical protein